ncbi:MAG: YigZ family protein [Aureispira sp.]|nr:YigZ family protein [Aureispira sp.]
MKDTYVTLAEPCIGELKDRGSKFIAYGYTVHSEAEIKQHLETLKKENFKACHFCYAYRLGLDGKKYRANDDGEPSGTAGRPILGQIDSFGLSNVLLVVVRYYGGTKLGTSGLKNAYKGAAKDAFEQANTIEKIVENYYNITFDYAQTSDVMNFLKSEGYNILESTYEEKTVLKVAVRLTDVELFSNKIKKIDQVKLEEIA